MSLPNYDTLEEIFEGKEYGKEQVFKEAEGSPLKPKFKQLEERGLIKVKCDRDLSGIFNFDGVEITEFGIEVLLDERRHKEKSTNNVMLVMVTCLYTIGTGALVVANSSNLFLNLLGSALIILGFIAYIIIAFKDKIISMKRNQNTASKEAKIN